MLVKKIAIFTLFILFFSFNTEKKEEKIKGITLVAAPDAIEAKAFEPLKNINANWVVINPFAFSFSEKSTKINYDSPRQWWGERPEGIKDASKKAHDAGFKIMLKPQVWIPGGWVGHVQFKDRSKKKEWQKAYRAYIMQMAGIAAELKMEMFCVGTEFDKTVLNDLGFWKDLIYEVRKVYNGKLTYAGNWTHYDQLEIWEDLDFIGIDAYFPLIESKTPSVEALKEAWIAKKEQIKLVSDKYKKPVIFAEYGYLSVDGCAFEHWKLEGKRDILRTNEVGQANAIEALLETFMPEDWWHGCFLWKWYPTKKANMGEGSWSKDYTPQGKLSEEVLKKCFEKF